MQIPFSPPDITPEEIKEVTEALKSGWITTGPKTKELEKEVANFCGVPRAACLNSQTACAELALRILGVGPGDEVITTAYTYTATASVINHVGAKIVLIDTQETSLEMDYQALSDAITEKTKVVIPVDIAGIPCDYEKIFSIVESKRALFRPMVLEETDETDMLRKLGAQIQHSIGRVIVLADTAHSFGAIWRGQKAGSIADFSAFSFHAVKNFTTAEGGALTWRPIENIEDENIYHNIQLLSLHGQSKDALAKTKLGAWEYDIVFPGFKCNMTDVLAGIGLAQMRRYSDLLARRKQIIKRYDEAFNPLGIISLNHYSEEHDSSGHLYITQIPGISYAERSEIIIKMAERGVACNVHYKPLPMLTAYKRLGFSIQNYPRAYHHFCQEITLPLHTRLSDEEVEYIIRCFSEIVQEYK